MEQCDHGMAFWVLQWVVSDLRVSRICAHVCMTARQAQQLNMQDTLALLPLLSGRLWNCKWHRQAGRTGKHVTGAVPCLHAQPPCQQAGLLMHAGGALHRSCSMLRMCYVLVYYPSETGMQLQQC